MSRAIKSVFFAAGVIMVFTAQTRQDDQQSHGQARPAAHAPSNKPRQAPTQRTTPQRSSLPQQRHTPQQRTPRPPQPQPQETRSVPAAYPSRSGPRVYGQQPAAPQQNNTLFHRQHHNHWQPRYNYYGNGYHFYPYVNIASMVELSGTGVMVSFNGQNFYFDQGTFYFQDDSGQYEAVAPPIGIIVPALPANAHVLNVDGQTYYRSKGIFYVQVPQGFQVIAPLAPDEGS